MKKVLALVLVLALILSAQTAAFAAKSPSGSTSGDNVPVDYYGPTEDETAADKAIATVSKDYDVESAEVYEEETIYSVPELDDDEVLVICDLNGNILRIIDAETSKILRDLEFKIVLPAGRVLVRARIR